MENYSKLRKLKVYLRAVGRLKSTLGEYFFCFLRRYFSCKPIELSTFIRIPQKIIKKQGIHTCENEVFFSNVELFVMRASIISFPLAPFLYHQSLFQYEGLKYFLRIKNNIILLLKKQNSTKRDLKFLLSQLIYIFSGKTLCFVIVNQFPIVLRLICTWALCILLNIVIA